MQVLLLLLLVLPVVIMIVRRAATPIKARLATFKSVLTSKPQFMFVTDGATAHHLLVRGRKAAAGGGSFSNCMPSMSPSAFLSGQLYHNITSAPYGQLWRALRHNLTSGVLHPTHQHRYAAARRQALRGLIADLREQQLTNGVALAAESIRGAVFRVISTICFGDGVDAAVVRAMDDVQMELVVALSTMRIFMSMSVPLQVASRLIYRKRWNKLTAIRQKQEELYLPLIDGCRSHRRHSDEALTYVHTLLDLRVPVELEADEAGAAGGKQRQQRRLEDGELVGLCSEFLGSATETTVASLQWIMANLMKRPGIQEAVRREIEAAVDADAEEVGEEVLGKLDYLNAVILEALRLHPTTARAFRQVMQEDQVVDHDGQRIPAGTTMVFVLDALGRDKTVWDDPEEFKPERFLACGGGESTKNLLSSMAGEMKMMPFGIGRRMCPAISMSLLHISYFMANLVREFEWGEVEGEHAVQLHTDPRIEMFNVMKRPLCAHLVPRRPEGKKIR
ncbi:cytochrome P450 89A2-like [Miscanthus floridulus]|uniref:cytochrome P450 89A2-like n=1 Tax=Miscanthus floridulus TaxID=154761 RepID=UPI0034583E3F